VKGKWGSSELLLWSWSPDGLGTSCQSPSVRQSQMPVHITVPALYWYLACYSIAHWAEVATPLLSSPSRSSGSRFSQHSAKAHRSDAQQSDGYLDISHGAFHRRAGGLAIRQAMTAPLIGASQICASPSPVVLLQSINGEAKGLFRNSCRDDSMKGNPGQRLMEKTCAPWCSCCWANFSQPLGQAQARPDSHLVSTNPRRRPAR
jgi:hypothetical protein